MYNGKALYVYALTAHAFVEQWHHGNNTFLRIQDDYISKSANTLCSGLRSSPVDGSCCRSACSVVVTVTDRPEKVMLLFSSSVNQG